MTRLTDHSPQLRTCQFDRSIPVGSEQLRSTSPACGPSHLSMALRADSPAHSSSYLSDKAGPIYPGRFDNPGRCFPRHRLSTYLLAPCRDISTRPLNSHPSCSRHIDDPRRVDSLPVDIPRPDSSPPSPIDKPARNDPRQLDHPIPANTGHLDSAPHLTARQPRASRPTISQPVISYHLDFSRQFASTRYSSTYQAVVTPCPRPATRRRSTAQDRAQPIDDPRPNRSCPSCSTSRPATLQSSSHRLRSPRQVISELLAPTYPGNSEHTKPGRQYTAAPSDSRPIDIASPRPPSPSQVDDPGRS